MTRDFSSVGRPVAWRGVAVVFALAVVLAFAQQQILLAAIAPHYDDQVAATMGVATGHPHWRLFQNRIAAPWMFAGLCHLGMEPARAYARLTLILLLMFYAVFAACLHSLLADLRSVRFGLCACFTMVAIFFQTPWFYPWDLIDLSVFAVFAWGLMRPVSRWVLLGVVALELLNREVALIMAVYLTADGAVDYWRTRRREILGQVIAGMGLAAFGVWFVEWLRSTLLIYATVPLKTGVPAGYSYNLQLKSNLGILLRHLGLAGYVSNLPQLALMAGCLAAALVQVRRRPRLGIFFTLLWGSVFALGAMLEWRIWLEFTPFVAMTVAAELNGGSTPPAASARS